MCKRPVEVVALAKMQRKASDICGPCRNSGIRGLSIVDVDFVARRVDSSALRSEVG